MFSQTELENYKLQVELLQEKLKRSEDERQQLEERYETVTKRRIEQEKSMKNEFRRKYYYLLEEQKQRNEKNKCLIKLLDKVDQQAAVLAARTERLRMLKIQYELYLTRMLQFQCIKSIENNIYYQPVQMPSKQQFPNLRSQGYSELYGPSDSAFKHPATEDAWTPLSAGDISASKNMPTYHSAPDYYRLPACSHLQSEQLLPAYDLQRHLNFKPTYGSGPGLIPNMPVKSLGDQKKKADLDRFENRSGATKSPSRDDRIQTADGTRLTPDTSYQSKNHETYNNRPSLSRIDSVDEKGLDSDRLRYLIPDNKRFQRNGSRDTDEYDIDDDDSIDNDEKPPQKQLVPATKDPKSDQAYLQQKEETQNVQTAPNERKISLSEIPLETVLKDISKLSFDRLKRQTKFNFGEENYSSKEDAQAGIQFKKKEKLSIENIENAIYGERIDPLARKLNEQLLQPEITEKYEQQKSIHDYVEKEQPHTDMTSNDGQQNNTLYSAEGIADDMKQSEANDQPTVLPLELDDIGSKILGTNHENEQPPLLQKMGNVEDSEQRNEKTEPSPNEDSVDKTVPDEDVIYDDYQPTPTQENDDAQEATFFPEQLPETDQKIEQNVYNTNVMEEQGHYDSAQYENTNYGYADEQGYYQDQGYEQQPGYAQQAYGALLPQEYDYSQQPTFSGDEYNQPYQDDTTYNYAFNENSNDQFAAETYQQSPSVDDQLNQEITNQNISNQVEETPQLQNASDFSKDNSVKSIITEPSGSNSTEPSQNQEHKVNEISELIENSVSELSKSDENLVSQQISPTPAITNIVPTSILSSGDKQVDSTNGGKKKKKVNFVDSETDDNSSQRAAPLAVTSNDESDFDFSSN